MPILIFAALLAWWAFGDPAKSVAGWFWPSDAAPWEKVDAFYYPDRTDLSRHTLMPGLSKADDCRMWVRQEAAFLNDPGMVRGDYECGIGKISNEYDLAVYRLTVR